MKYGIIWVDQIYTKNKIFDESDAYLNRDDCMYHYRLLKKELKKKHDIDLVTQDMADPANAEFVLYNDLPATGTLFYPGKSYLLLWECEVVKNMQWVNYQKLNIFEKVFSWYDLHTDDVYRKMYWPQKMDKAIAPEKSKFLCIIAGHSKQSLHYKELYSARQDAVKYFGDKIDVYGYPHNPIENKLDVLKDYKFAICFENARDIPGYVTEKIFDCFKVGTVPIYWGNDYDKKMVSDISVIDAYIDFGKYRDNSDKPKWKQLDDDITNMSAQQYNDMQQIGNRVISPTSCYSAENWVLGIIRQVVPQ